MGRPKLENSGLDEAKSLSIKFPHEVEAWLDEMVNCGWSKKQVILFSLLKVKNDGLLKKSE